MIPSTITSEAVATFLAGLLAVGAALIVGLRQTEVQKRQAKIQENSLKHDLFDRRYKIFQACEKFLIEIVQQADDPSVETNRDFIFAVGESRFLFKDNVQEGLREIYNRWAEFHALNIVMKTSYNQAGHYGDGNPEKERAALEWFHQSFQNLPELFKDMKLDA